MADDESIVIKPREFPADLLLPENTSELAKFMDEPFPAIAEMITGAMAAGPRSWMIMGGRIVQSMFKAKLFQQVSQEIKDLRDMGAIPDDYADESKYRYGAKTWVELMSAIDEETPDADRLDALKAMFYGANRINATDADRILAYQMFQTAKRLNSGELLTLKCAHDAHKAGLYEGVVGKPEGPIVSVLDWARKICGQSGHRLVDIVLRYQGRLVEEGLISAYVGSVESHENHRRVDVQNARMTDFGIRFCTTIYDYQLVREQIDLKAKQNRNSGSV